MILRIYSFGLLLILFSISFGQEPRTNQSILEEQFVVLFDSLKNDLLIDSSGVSLQIGSISGEKNAFITNNFIKYFTRNRIPVRHKKAKYVFVFEQFDAEFLYQEKMKRLMGFQNKLKRQLNFKVEGWIEDKRDSEGKIVSSFSFQKNYHDIIDSGCTDLIEQSAYSFMRGKLISCSSWTKYIEPLVVIVSVSAVIYLFFTMRT